MAEAVPAPTGASDAATQKPAQTEPAKQPDTVDLQKIRDGVWADARKKFEPQLAERDAALAKLKEELTAEREWRMGRLDEQARSLNLPESVTRIAREKGAADYEAIIADFAKQRPATPATPAPAPQPGGKVSGEAPPAMLGEFTAEQIDPMRNGGSPKVYRALVQKFGRSTVDNFLASADKAKR